MNFSNRLTAMLGCRYPIIQTGMGWVSNPELTAATCNAGGFGFLAGATIAPAEMELAILDTKRLTPAPFGVNFHMYQPNAEDICRLVIAHGVRAVSYSRSPGKAMVGRLKAAGVVLMPTVGLLKHARKALEMGADAVTVQGSEGGGHTGAVATSLLVPQVVDAVGADIPVVAAGGFKDGRGLVAALAWGADGVAMGTRFLMAKESPVPIATKQRYLDCTEPGDIIVSRALDGLPQRMVLNEFLQSLESSSQWQRLWQALKNTYRYRQFTNMGLKTMLKTIITVLWSDGLAASQMLFSANAPMIIQKAMVEGHPEEGVLPSGQVAAVIDGLLSCQEIIDGIVGEARQCLLGLQRNFLSEPDVSAMILGQEQRHPPERRH